MTPKNDLYDYQVWREIPSTSPPSAAALRRNQTSDEEEKEEYVMYANRLVNKKTFGKRGPINRPFIIK